MEIIINLDELKIASKEIQNEVEALQGLTSSIEKAIRPLFLMKSARLEAYLELYNKANISLHESVALLAYISQEMKQFALDIELAIKD